MHRTGVTGRAGADGLVISLVDPSQRAEITAIQKALELPLGLHRIDATLVGSDARPELVERWDARNGRGTNGGGRSAGKGSARGGSRNRAKGGARSSAQRSSNGGGRSTDGQRRTDAATDTAGQPRRRARTGGRARARTGQPRTRAA